MLRKLIISFLLLAFSINNAPAQVQYGHLGRSIDSIIQAMPGKGQNDYQRPTSHQLSNWQQTVQLILQDSLGQARVYADSIGYTIQTFQDTFLDNSQMFYILKEEKPKSNYSGTYVFHPNPCRKKLVIQAPHPKYDLNTGREGIYCFRRLSARAFMMSGTHRCNHQDTSACSGMTSVCGNSPAPYKISDMAHNVGTAFQKVTDVVQKEVASSVFCQLHGFSKQPNDPYVIMSNGTRMTPANDYIQDMETELAQIDSALTFKIAHKDTNWYRLIGFTNVQGRLINNSPSPCSQTADTTKGRFIHLEQERTRLRADSTGWQKVYQALAGTFPCIPTSDHTPLSHKETPFKIFPNPAADRVWIKGAPMDEIGILNRKGNVMYNKKTFGKTNIELNMSAYDKGLYFVLIRTSKEERTTTVKLLIGNRHKD